MSSSVRFPEFSSQKARVAEKPSFSQTCNLLSQYLKGKGSFGGLGLVMSRNVDGNGTPDLPRPTPTTTMDLFPISYKLAEKSPEDEVAPEGSNPKSPALSLQETQSSSSAKCVTKEPETAPMTIFYGGQVIVFNDFPAEKAEEIMRLASRGSVQNPASSFGPGHDNSMSKPAEAGTAISRSPSVPKFGESAVCEAIQAPSRPSLSADLPLSRKASLHRFLEKRKDRINARAPYQTSTPKASGNSSWLGLATQ